MCMSAVNIRSIVCRCFFFSSRRRHTRCSRDWSSDVCSSDLVGASGPIVGFVFAIPALVYGVMHAKLVPGLANPAHAELIYGTPFLLRLLEAALHRGISPDALLLPPIGRAAWVALFVTSLNLVPVAQLDGGHILRSLNVRAHRFLSLALPVGLIALCWLHFWEGWYI